MKALIILVAFLGSVSAYLTGGDVTCDAESEGRIITVPRITDITPCIQCRCSGGVVKCADRSKSCPSIRGCYNIVPTRDKCCPYKCKDCGSNVRRPHGSLWVQGDALHTCYAGIVTHFALSFTSEKNPRSTNSCKTPSNQILRPFQTLPDPSDPSCSTCICLPSGRLHCLNRACPVLDCPPRLIVKKPSQCCPSCSRNRDLRLPPSNSTCVFQGKAYPSGASLPEASCPQTTKCTCHSGLPVCERQPCPGPTSCPPGSSRVPGPCCPECSRPLGPVLGGYKSSTCISGMKAYKEGQSWSLGDCVTCECAKGGEVKCKTETCETAVCPPGHERVRKTSGGCCEWECLPKKGICTVFGDPHYRTFDGRIFNFQGGCKYLLSQECDPFTGTPLKNSSFSIRVTNDARRTSVFSWTRTVTVRTPGLRVSLLQKMRVKINGKRVSLPYIKLGTLSIMQDGYRIVLRTNEGVRVLWDGISFLEVALPPKYRNRVCGLCGNFNGDNRDDLFGSFGKGKKITKNAQFGESWRVGGLKSCSHAPSKDMKSVEPSCSQNWESRIQSDRNCNAFRSPLFESCRSVIPVDYYYNACKLDMCECPGDSCHCEVLTAYARECERSGILLKGWREASDCGNVSSFSYPGKEDCKTCGSLPGLRDDKKVISRSRNEHRKQLARRKKAKLKKQLRRRQKERKSSSASKKDRKELRRKRRRRKKRRKRKHPPHFEALLMGEDSFSERKSSGRRRKEDIP